MSVKVSAWIWEHASDPKRHRGTVKLLLLALADHANDNGVCWPAVSTLADKIGETERHTRRLLKELVEAGDVLTAPGGGRGNTTRYAIAIGLSDKQREKLNSVLQNSVSQNTVYENTDIENSVLQGQKQCPTGTETVTSGHATEGPNSASERPKVAKKEEDNHHGTIMEPSNNTRRAVRAPPSGDHQQLMTAYQEWLGYPIPNGGKEGAAARKLLKAGYTAEQIDDCYHELKSRDFYSRGHLSLQTVHEQIGAVLRKKGPHRARARPLELPVPTPPPARLTPAEIAARMNGEHPNDRT